jgi:hypothetical protein
MRIFLLVTALVLFEARADEHEKKREPAGARPETETGDGVLDEFKTSLDDLYSATKGETRAKPEGTGESKKPSPFWSIPK